MDGRWMGIVLLGCDAMKQTNRRRLKHEREDGGWNVHDGFDERGMDVDGSNVEWHALAPPLSFRFVSLSDRGGFQYTSRSKPSLVALGRHWIAPSEAKDGARSHAIPTKNERIDGKKSRTKRIHKTRYTHPSTIDHETRHDAIVRRPTPGSSCFFFVFFFRRTTTSIHNVRLAWFGSVRTLSVPHAFACNDLDVFAPPRTPYFHCPFVPSFVASVVLWFRCVPRNAPSDSVHSETITLLPLSFAGKER